MSLPRDGVSFVAEGADKFIADLNRVGVTYNETTGRFRDASGKFVAANNAMAGAAGGIEQQASGFVGATDMMSGGLSLLDGVTLGAGKALFDFAVSIPGMVIGALKSVAGAVLDVGKSIGGLANEASKLQGVAAGFGNFAAQTEMGAEAILFSLKAASAGMVSTQDLMTKFNDAAALVSVQFAERLPEGLEILGKVSAATGTDVNYLLDSFVTGIGRVSPAILDNLKIQVSSAEATARAAEMFGKEEDALSKVEQQMALTDITLEKLTEKFGGLPDVTQSATANLARIDAVLADIRAQIGSAFLPAWTAATGAIANAVTYFSQAISEGGALFPVLANLGAAASLMADGFSQAVDSVINFVSGVQTSISTGLADAASNAMSWGTNIAVSFAQGLIDGAATALTVAMNFISGMLSGWLSPGSPPKVAPDLPKWGMSAMTQFLEGFDQADFGMLKSLQGPLSKVLGDTDFAEISQEIAGAISAGEIDEGLFDTIAASAGEFGTEIADLARLEFELATSTEAVAQAQNDLAASGQAVSDSQAKVAGLTAEYNQLLRSGATEEQLDAQLALINAAEQQRDAAIEQNAANQTALATAEDASTADADRVANQRDLVDQLIALSQAEEAAASAVSGAGAGAAAGLSLPGGAVGGAGVATPALDTMLPDIGALGDAFDFTGGLETAIDAAKLTIAEKFGSIFDPVKEIIAEKFGPDSPIGQQWGTIAGQIETVWTTKLVPFWEDTLVPAVETVQTAFTNMQTFWESSTIPELAGKAFGIFLDTVQSLAERIIPFLTEQLLKISQWFVDNGPRIDTIVAAIVTAWETVAPAFVLAWDVIEPILGATVTQILNLGTMILQFATGDWAGAWETMQQGPVITFEAIQASMAVVWTWVTENLFPLLGDLGVWLEESIPAAIDILVGYWEETLLPAMTAVWTWVTDNLIPLWETLTAWLEETIPVAIDTLVSYWEETLLPAMEAVWKWVDETLMPLFEALDLLFSETLTLTLTAMAGLWEKTLQPALEAAWKFIDESLLPVFKDIGTEIGTVLQPILDTLSTFLGGALKLAFDGISTAIKAVTTIVGKMAEAIGSVSLPDWMTPGSPTPWEIGLRGITDAMGELTKGPLADLEMGLDLQMPDLENAMQPLLQPTFTGAMDAAQTQPIMREVSISIGPNYFQSGDAQQLRRTIQQVLRAELRRN